MASVVIMKAGKDQQSVKKDLDDFIGRFLSYAIVRMSAIRRYNTRKFIIAQNDLEHIGSVTMIAMVFSDYFNNMGIGNNTEKVLRLAITHDLDEIVSGDVPHDAKYQQGIHSNKFRSALEQLSEVTIENMYNMIRYRGMRDRYMGLYKEERAKSSIEARIVKLADFTDVIIYVKSEMKLGNNALHEEKANAERRFNELLSQILKNKKLN